MIGVETDWPPEVETPGPTFKLNGITDAEFRAGRAEEVLPRLIRRTCRS